MIVLRYVGTTLRDLALYVLRVGAWWVPVAMVVLGVAVLLAITAQIVVPHAVYVLF